MYSTKFAALYCRLSKSDEGNIESNSIANQKSAILRTAHAYGYENIQFFIDDGYGGSDFNRPALKEMEAAIIAGLVSVVIVKDAYVKLRIKFMQVYFGQENSTAS